MKNADPKKGAAKRYQKVQLENNFTYYALRPWNLLPQEVALASSIDSFKKSLKSHIMFDLVFPP